MKTIGYLVMALMMVGAIQSLDLCSFCGQFEAGSQVTVCAANGKTYKNGCFAWCNKSRVVHPGACNVNHNPCDCPTGRDNYKPVCSFEGETFDNICISKCYGKDSASSDFCLISNLKDNSENNHFPDLISIPLHIRDDKAAGSVHTGINQYPTGLIPRGSQGWEGINKIDKYNDRHSNNYRGLLNQPILNPGQASA